MDAKKIGIFVVAICVIISCEVTYYLMDISKQEELITQKNYYECEMDNLRSYVSYVESVTDLVNEEKKDLKNLLNNTIEELLLINISLQENLTELKNLRNGDNYELHDPTYNEVANFIIQDKTNELKYVKGIFDCEQFSQQINQNAENVGIRCAYVILYFYDTDVGHGIVGFNTVDRGMVYIEPQSDEWVENLEEGNDFWTDCLVPKGNYYYEEAPNDTIKDILLFW